MGKGYECGLWSVGFGLWNQHHFPFPCLAPTYGYGLGKQRGNDKSIISFSFGDLQIITQFHPHNPALMVETMRYEEHISLSQTNIFSHNHNPNTGINLTYPSFPFPTPHKLGAKHYLMFKLGAIPSSYCSKHHLCLTRNQQWMVQVEMLNQGVKP